MGCGVLEVIEKWRPILGFKGYEVSDMGRVRSLPRKRLDGYCRLEGKMLSVRGTGPGGRPRVSLSRKNNKRAWKLVYRLVLEAFVGPCPKGKEACHYPDRTVTNCKLKNLRWGYHRENAEHMIAHGRVNPNRARDGRFTSYVENCT